MWQNRRQNCCCGVNPIAHRGGYTRRCSAQYIRSSSCGLDGSFLSVFNSSRLCIIILVVFLFNNSQSGLSWLPPQLIRKRLHLFNPSLAIQLEFSLPSSIWLAQSLDLGFGIIQNSDDRGLVFPVQQPCPTKYDLRMGHRFHHIAANNECNGLLFWGNRINYDINLLLWGYNRWCPFVCLDNKIISTNTLAYTPSGQSRSEGLTIRQICVTFSPGKTVDKVTRRWSKVDKAYRSTNFVVGALHLDHMRPVFHQFRSLPDTSFYSAHADICIWRLLESWWSFIQALRDGLLQISRKPFFIKRWFTHFSNPLHRLSSRSFKSVRHHLSKCFNRRFAILLRHSLRLRSRSFCCSLRIARVAPFSPTVACANAHLDHVFYRTSSFADENNVEPAVPPFTTRRGKWPLPQNPGGGGEMRIVVWIFLRPSGAGTAVSSPRSIVTSEDRLSFPGTQISVSIGIKPSNAGLRYQVSV